MTRCLWLLPLLLCLAGCVSAEEAKQRDAERSAADQAQCAKQGYKPGTDSFAKCQLQARDIRLQNRIDQTSVTFNPYSGSPIPSRPGGDLMLGRSGAGESLPGDNMLH